MRRSQSFDFPEQREPLGDPSHAGNPDDSTVFCGESIWTGESGLAWQQVGVNAFRFISRSVGLILSEKVGSSGGCGLGHSREPGIPGPWLQHSCGCAVSPVAGVSWLGSAFSSLSHQQVYCSPAEGSSLLCPGTWASQSGEQMLGTCTLSPGAGEEGKPSPA